MLIFNENNGNYFIKWAQMENTKYETTHMTQFSTIELEKFKSKGLDFHYELHFSQKEQFVRFDCSCYQYADHKNVSKDEFLMQLSLDGHENLLQTRTKLKNEFKKEFSSSQYKLSRDKYNYACLLKYIFIAHDYNGAIKESEKFIKDTYEKIMEIIKSVVKI